MSINKKTLEKEKAEIIKKIYDLGFEVGLKNHSEIGWVLREYNSLAENAQTLGIKAPESYYNNGKIDGRKNKDKDNEVKIIGKSAGSLNKSSFIEKLESGSVTHPNKKPRLTELPCFVKQPRSLRMPRLLKGFRLTKLSDSK